MELREARAYAQAIGRLIEREQEGSDAGS